VDSNGKAVALWAGITTLFTNIAAINLVAFVGDESDARVTAIAALITSICVAGSVYAKHRWDDAKEQKERSGQNT
jgi:hypothetical protein